MKQYQLSALRKDGTAYIEFLRTTQMSVGVYRLSAGNEDTQSPHNEEEVYFVVSGRAQFRAGDDDRMVGPGNGGVHRNESRPVWGRVDLQ